MTTTSRPLSRVKEDRFGPLPSVRPKDAASARRMGLEAVSMMFQPWRHQIVSLDQTYGNSQIRGVRKRGSETFRWGGNLRREPEPGLAFQAPIMFSGEAGDPVRLKIREVMLV